MRKFTRVTSIIAVLILFIYPLSYMANEDKKENIFHDLTTNVLLHDDGVGTIIQNWEIELYGNTELYIKLTEISYMNTSNISVSDEISGFYEYISPEKWQTFTKREEKIGKYSVINKEEYKEIVWGIRDYGITTYQIQYDSDHVVQQEKNVTEQFLFLEFAPNTLSMPPQHVKTTIEKENGTFPENSIGGSAYGYVGLLENRNGKVVAETQKPLVAGEHQLLLLHFRDHHFEINPDTITFYKRLRIDDYERIIDIETYENLLRGEQPERQKGVHITDFTSDILILKNGKAEVTNHLEIDFPDGISETRQMMSQCEIQILNVKTGDVLQEVSGEAEAAKQDISYYWDNDELVIYSTSAKEGIFEMNYITPLFHEKRKEGKPEVVSNITYPQAESIQSAKATVRKGPSVFKSGLRLSGPSRREVDGADTKDMIELDLLAELNNESSWWNEVGNLEQDKITMVSIIDNFFFFSRFSIGLSAKTRGLWQVLISVITMMLLLMFLVLRSENRKVKKQFEKDNSKYIYPLSKKIRVDRYEPRDDVPSIHTLESLYHMQRIMKIQTNDRQLMSAIFMKWLLAGAVVFEKEQLHFLKTEGNAPLEEQDLYEFLKKSASEKNSVTVETFFDFLANNFEEWRKITHNILENGALYLEKEGMIYTKRLKIDEIVLTPSGEKESKDLSGFIKYLENANIMKEGICKHNENHVEIYLQIMVLFDVTVENSSRYFSKLFPDVSTVIKKNDLKLMHEFMKKFDTIFPHILKGKQNENLASKSSSSGGDSDGFWSSSDYSSSGSSSDSGFSSSDFGGFSGGGAR